MIDETMLDELDSHADRMMPLLQAEIQHKRGLRVTFTTMSGFSDNGFVLAFIANESNITFTASDITNLSEKFDNWSQGKMKLQPINEGKEENCLCLVVKDRPVIGTSYRVIS